MMLMDIFFLTCLISLITGFISSITQSEGIEFVNPIWLYKKYKVNWFGALVLSILFNILTLPFSIFYWIYKLCTVGRE